MTLSEYKAKLNQMKGKKDSLSRQLENCNELHGKAEKRQVTLELTQALIQKVAQDTQSQLKFCLEDIVNTLLKTCFSDDYEFKISFDLKRSRTEATLYLYKNGYEVQPKGGIADIISLGLRLAVWNIGNTRNTLCLDESLKWLSADLQPRAAEVLKEISSKLGIQILMPSHVSAFIESADKIYTVRNIDGVSHVS